MSAKILDGKSLAKTLTNELSQEILTLSYQPGLAVVLVGDDPAAEIYVKRKRTACEEVGIRSFPYYLGSEITEVELLNLIQELNQNNEVDGILVQLPLPPHIDKQKMIEAIHPHKDVDGFHPYNIGRLLQRTPTLRPCTPWGVMYLLKHTGIELPGKHAVVIGASNIVGKPMALELLLTGCTVTVCHQATKDLRHHVEQADILVSATGKPELVQGEWIKPGSILIDVGIHRRTDGTLQGDIEFRKASEKAAWITPVPGGVGPMTVAMLMQNTLLASKMRR